MILTVWSDDAKDSVACMNKLEIFKRSKIKFIVLWDGQMDWTFISICTFFTIRIIRIYRVVDDTTIERIEKGWTNVFGWRTNIRVYYFYEKSSHRTISIIINFDLIVQQSKD